MRESSYLSYLLKEKYKLTESQEQSEKRLTALRKLVAVANDWAGCVARRKGATEEELKNLTIVKIKVFGSFMLGVHFPDTDIDVICIFKAKYISQVDFFTDFVKTLNQEECVSDICEVESARVPIIKFSLYDV